jgi:hypothetical protein
MRYLLCPVGGALISGLGLGLCYAGGWGPCGPASTVAHVGGILCVYHLTPPCEWFPALNRWLIDGQSGVLNVAVLLAVPTMTWTSVLVMLVFVATKLRRPRRRPAAEPSEDTHA